MSRSLNPNISTDIVIFGYSAECLCVLLVERQFSISASTGELIHDLKLPGGLVYNDELLKDAAQRILHELTGLEGIALKQFDLLDSLQRMNNKLDKLWLEQTSGLAIDRVISVAFNGLVKLDDKNITPLTKGARWVALSQTKNLPFDHNEIIRKGLDDIRSRSKKDGTIFNLLPEKFTINELQNIISVFYGYKQDNRNFRKKIKKLDYIIPLAERQRHVAHKPALFYRFDKRKFQQFANYKISF